MMKVDKDTFFKIIYKFDVVPFLQSKGWYESMNFQNVVFYVDSDSDPNIGCWGVITTHKVIGCKLIIDAYCHKSQISPKQITKFYSDIIDSCEYDTVYLSDIEKADANTQIALRRSGFIRPLALTLCPMSILVDTTKDFSFHRNWRRQVTKSVNSGSKFEIYTTPSDEVLEIFVNMFNELKDRKSLGFGISVQGLRAMLNTNDFFLSLVRNENGKPLCGRITYLRNNHAYDVYAANSDEALATGAVYQNQQQLFEYLKSIGTIDFDYGRIPPGRDSMDNIYIAKSYSGGEPIIYNGEWEYTKSSKINWFYSLYRFCIRKAKRY